MPETMAPWLSPAFGAAVFIAVYLVSVRAASGRIEDRLGSLVLEGSAVLGIALTLALGMRGTMVPTTRAGLAFSIAGGLGVAVASILLFSALRRGGPVASIGTIVMGGGVALSALVAPALFGETFTARRVLGVTLGLAAMWVLGTES
jgi:uncharacterized membrane protein